MMLHRNDARRSLAMLVGDALAPVLGALVASSVAFPPAALLPYLGAFAGFLLYIAAADILPQAHSQAGPRQAMRVIGLTALGAAFAWAVVQLAS